MLHGGATPKPTMCWSNCEEILDALDASSDLQYPKLSLPTSQVYDPTKDHLRTLGFCASLSSKAAKLPPHAMT